MSGEDRTLMGRALGIISAVALGLGLMFGADPATLALLTAGTALGVAVDRWGE